MIGMIVKIVEITSVVADEAIGASMTAVEVEVSVIIVGLVRTEGHVSLVKTVVSG